MGELRVQRPVLLITAAFSRYPAALDWARETTAAAWGPIALESDRLPFVDTKFYDRTMGTELLKCFFAFERLIDPGVLPERKLESNDWEEAFRLSHAFPEARPLNLDPGYLSEAKLVLATTKDRDHRLFLARGIYGEVTLHYQQNAWQIHPWTYPDYRSPAYHEFFQRCRDYLRKRYRSDPEPFSKPDA